MRSHTLRDNGGTTLRETSSTPNRCTEARFGFGREKKVEVKAEPQGWQEELASELHKPIKRNFPKRRVIVNGIDDTWCSDLVEMQKFAKWNKGYRYLLMVLDIFSKYGWIVPLKNKNGESVAEGFKKIFAEGRKPKRLWTDKGSEYYNTHVKDLLKANGVELYSTENEEKSSVCERWNRTIKTKMWKQFTIQNNTVYLDILPKIVEKYNNTKHRSIGMTPVEASKKKNENAVYLKLYGEELSEMREKPKFAVGDHVRISKYKRKLFDKGYTPNWSEEIFVVDEIQYSKPITYKLKDLLGEEIKGSFYEQEMLKAKQSDLFRIEKVIRKIKGKALVKWSGYPEKFNSWIDESDLQKL
ncbi:TPA_asm: integrase [Stylophora coral adintovirus]|nr:TPA_asm: integrase [Stylophora coral adintovirus]